VQGRSKPIGIIGNNTMLKKENQGKQALPAHR
jgi:hypothetical protein